MKLSVTKEEAKHLAYVVKNHIRCLGCTASCKREDKENRKLAAKIRKQIKEATK